MKMRLKVLSQRLAEERHAVEGDLVHAVIEVDVIDVRNDHQFLRLRRRRVSGFTEVARVGVFAANEEEALSVAKRRG